MLVQYLAVRVSCTPKSLQAARVGLASCRSGSESSNHIMSVALLIAAISALLLLGTWLLYPLVAVLTARLRPRAARSARGWQPRVTVILASREAVDPIRERVSNILEADYPPHLLDVVVGLERGCGTNPDDIAVSRVRVVLGDEPGGKACNLNAAVREADGEVLVFTDTYQRFASDTISLLVEDLSDDRFGAVSGALILPGEQVGRTTLVERYWQLERVLREAEAVTSSTVGVTGAVYALRKDLWSPLPPGLILDDLFVPMRVVLAGRRVGFVRDALAFDTREAAPGREYGRKVRTLTGNFQLCAWLPAVLVPGRNPIWWRFVWHKLMRLATPFLCAMLLLSLLVAVSMWRPNIVLLLCVLLAASALLIAWAPTRTLARLRDTARWGVAMQAAAVSAAIRGLRGQWDVWQ